jgi:phage shock protein PspC (stress-responsive transcriptional regulator)
MARSLYRSENDRVLAGVCGGLADYFDIDPVVVRLGWVLCSLFAGAGVLLYLVAWVVVPTEDGRRASLPLALLFVLFVLPTLCIVCAVATGGLFGPALGH